MDWKLTVFLLIGVLAVRADDKAVAALEDKQPLAAAASAEPLMAKTDGGLDVKIEGVEGPKALPRVLKHVKHNGEETKQKKSHKNGHKNGHKKSKAKRVARKAMSYQFSDTNLNETAQKLKDARQEVAEQKKYRSNNFRKLLQNLNLDSHSFQLLDQIKDKELAQQVRNLKDAIEKISPALWKRKDPNFKKYARKMKATIKQQITNQVKTYRTWRKLSCKKIESVWKQKNIYYHRDDNLNREEHEKLYQLFLIEDADKLNFLLPMVEVEKRLVEMLDRRIVDEDNEKYILLAIKLMTKQLFLEYVKRFKKYHSRHRKDYAKDLKAMDKALMDSFKENEEFYATAGVD
jgi:rubrerythrin